MPSVRSVSSLPHTALRVLRVDGSASSHRTSPSSRYESHRPDMSDNSAVGKSPKDEDARSIVSSTRSIASHRSSRSSSTASTLSLLSASSRTPGSSLATSNVSLRELESKKLEIERELRRVQQELEERQKESFKILK